MRPIHLVALDKTRPAVVLTREPVRDHARRVTVAPITSRVRGLSTEVDVGAMNGLDSPSVISIDTIMTVDRAQVGRLVGWLLPHQEHALASAISTAFDLELPGRGE
jgi:mRNA interferase MazF